MTDATTVVLKPPRSQWADVWAQFRHHKGAMAALVLLIVLMVFVLIGPLVWRTDPNFIEPNTAKMFNKVSTAIVTAAP